MVEAIGVFCLVLVILSVVFSKKSLKDWGPLAIGTTFVFMVMVGGPLTGGCFNPARWFGAALVGNAWGGPGPTWSARSSARCSPRRLELRARGRRTGSDRAAASGSSRRPRPAAPQKPEPQLSSRTRRARLGACSSFEPRAPGHLLAELHALPLAHLPVLLQVLRLRDAPGPRPRAGRGRTPARRGAANATPRSCWSSPGEQPEVNPVVAARLAEWGHEDFTSYVVWACERALERGMLPHTNIGVLEQRGPGRLREVTASQGLMLESISERLMETVHAGSPTKHPGQAPGDDRSCRRAEDPLHQRHPGRHRRDRGGAGRIAGSSGGRCTSATAISRR